MDELFDFSWTVAARGYALDKNGAVLTIKGPDYSARRYWPLRDYPALFQNFVSMKCTPENVLEFANQYGWLGLRGEGNRSRQREDDVPARQCNPEAHAAPLMVGDGEAIDEWAWSQCELNRAVSLWKMWWDNDQRGLARVLRWADDQWHFRAYFPEESDQRLTPIAPVRGFPFDRDSIMTVAAILVQRLINRMFASRRGFAVPRIVYDLDRRQQALKIVPASLLGALWLQFADAVTGHKSYRSCIVCHTWFEISSKGRGATYRKVFCSNACKVRDYRGKKQQSTARKGKTYVKKTSRSR